MSFEVVVILSSPVALWAVPTPTSLVSRAVFLPRVAVSLPAPAEQYLVGAASGSQ